MNYSLEDFLLFAPQTYYRLFELYNTAMWPVGHLLAGFGGLAILVLLFTGTAWRERVIFLLLAAGWSWVAWGYFLMRYASINWAADYYAYGFLLQSALLLLFALLGGRMAVPLQTGQIGWAERGGLGVLIFALLVQPLIAPWLGRDLTHMEIAGLAPDPTVTATLGVIMMMRNKTRWLLLPIPILWSAMTGLTLWAMNAPDALLMPLLALFAILAMVAESLRADLRMGSA